MAKRKDILDKGKRTHSPYFTLRHIKDSSGTTKISFIIGSKVLKKAVDRNRLRRLARVAVQKTKNDIKDGFEAVIFFKKPAVNLKTKDLEVQILEILNKAKLIK